MGNGDSSDKDNDNSGISGTINGSGGHSGSGGHRQQSTKSGSKRNGGSCDCATAWRRQWWR
jgi:hypothetical protein